MLLKSAVRTGAARLFAVVLIANCTGTFVAAFAEPAATATAPTNATPTNALLNTCFDMLRLLRQVAQRRCAANGKKQKFGCHYEFYKCPARLPIISSLDDPPEPAICRTRPSRKHTALTLPLRHLGRENC